jgi:predicted acyl esterase
MIGRDWVWRQGIFELGRIATWCAITWMDKELHDWDIELDWNVRPLADVIPSTFGGRTSPVLSRLASLREHDPFWVDAVYGGRNPVFGSSVAGLHSGGWWDSFSRGQITDWALASRTSSHPHRLIMDAVDHYLGEWSLEAAGLPNFDAMSISELSDYGTASMQGASRAVRSGHLRPRQPASSRVLEADP